MVDSGDLGGGWTFALASSGWLKLIAVSNLLAARAQMAISLGFHIIFAEIGIGMPAMMVLAEWRWRKTGDDVWLELAKRWAKGTAILFAIGAVSGTVLSFELGLLWPRFMEFAGPVIGIPFSLEGFAFFTEAIFLGIYLYGWERVSPRTHLFSGIVVALSGMASAVFVVMVNAWMNTPRGITLVNGRIAAVDPIAGMLNPSTFQQALHMVLAAYAATGIAVAGVHAIVLLRGSTRRFHRVRARRVARDRRASGGAAADLRRLERADRRDYAARQARGARGTVRHRGRRAACASAAGPTSTRAALGSRSRFRAGCRCSRFTIRARR